MEKITGRVKDLAKCYGAGGVGIVATEMLAGGPPSTDLSYVLPKAKSAGYREAISLEEAKKRLASMDPETRALYEKT